MNVVQEYLLFKALFFFIFICGLLQSHMSGLSHEKGFDFLLYLFISQKRSFKLKYLYIFFWIKAFIFSYIYFSESIL